MDRGTRSSTPVDLAGSVYGTILASSILVALGYKGGNVLVMIVALVAADIVFALAHVWSALLEAGAARGGLPSARDLPDALEHEWPVLQAVWPGVVALLLAALGLYSADTAINVALAANAAILFLWGFTLARLQGAQPPLAVGAGVITGGFGVGLVTLKVLVH